MTDIRNQQIDDFLTQVRAFLTNPPAPTFGQSEAFEKLVDEMGALAWPSKSVHEEVLAFAEDRAGSTKRKKVLARLAALLDNPIGAPEEGGWPIIPQETLHEFWGVVSDLGDLCFARDEDSDSALEIAIGYRKKYRLHSALEAHVPANIYDPDVVDEAAATEYFAEQTRTAKYLIDCGNTILNQLSGYLSMRQSRMVKQKRLTDECGEVRSLVRDGKLTEASERIAALVDKYDPAPVVNGEPLARTSTLRRIPDELADVISEYGEALPQETVALALTDLNGRLDMLEPMVGNGDLFKKANRAVLDEIWRHQSLIGKRVLQPVIRRYNEMAEDDRVLRRRAMKEMAQ